jgi:hypothetical protein
MARSQLVPVEELQAFLNVPEGTDEDVLLALIDVVQSLFEAACNRHERPFMASAVRTEVRDGTGSSALFLDYPISALTSVTLGYNAAAPEETLDVADKSVLVWGANGERIMRVDGGVFGELDQPRYVQVVYTTADHFPAPARLAVLRGAAAVYRQRGSEDARTERLGGYSTDLARVLEDQPEWHAGIAACWVSRV